MIETSSACALQRGLLTGGWLCRLGHILEKLEHRTQDLIVTLTQASLLSDTSPTWFVSNPAFVIWLMKKKCFWIVYLNCQCFTQVLSTSQPGLTLFLEKIVLGTCLCHSEVPHHTQPTVWSCTHPSNHSAYRIPASLHSDTTQFLLQSRK